ncbi:hypothetical protein KAJ87_04105, partial [Candidatus Pacearchaeota archaeon]|nr:hypothetical protein [Candidatus Pacearchaeota archaeon]
EIIEEKTTLEALGSQSFIFNLIMDVDGLTKISIIPVFKTNGKESTGNVLSTYDLSSGTSSGSSGTTPCVPAVGDPCESAECGSVENGTCGQVSCGTCNSGYSCESGTCVVDSTPCNLTSASWSETSVAEGTLVSLNVQGTNCEGKNIVFSIYERDDVSEGGFDDDIDLDFSTVIFSGTAVTSWTTVFHNDCLGACLPSEHYFVAKVVGESGEVTSGELSVSQILQTCAEMGGQECGEGTSCDVAVVVASDTDYCCLENCVVETGYICGNDITEPGEACDGVDVNGYDCSSIAAGFVSGSISCSSDCQRYITTSCVAGNTINAVSCSQEDVQDAIDLAVDGDTVLVPAGSCTWTTISGPTVRLNKGIILKGAGVGQTTIIDDTGHDWNERALWVDVDKPNTWRITEMSFTDILSESVSDGVISINGNSDSWRIDHLEFYELNKQAIRTRSYTQGVIDHCIFKDQYRAAIYLINYMSGEDSPDSLWSRPTELGTKDAIYLEDCVYEVFGETHPAVDGEYGLSWVFRNNNLTNFWVLNHGYESSRSAIKMEVYNNTFNVIDYTFRVINYRGGTGVVFNNKVIGNPYYFVGVMYYCTCANESGGGCRTDLGQIECTEYPCLDQPGRTYNQILAPIYQWDNTWDTGSTDFYVWALFSCPLSNNDIMQENRDFYNDVPKPGYVPYPYPHPLTLN